MTLVILFIALVVERFFDFSHLRHWNWYAHLANTLIRRIKISSPHILITILTLPLIFLLAVINLCMVNVLYGLVTILMHILILMYCLGPRNLWADAYTSLNTLKGDPIETAVDKLKLTFNIVDKSRQTRDLRRILLEEYFVACNNRVFACIVFYVIFGIVGVVFYRLVSLLAHDNMHPPLVRDIGPDVVLSSQTLLDVLDWIPIRILTFLFALGGNFMQVFSTWVRMVLDGISFNKKLLIECGFKALGDETKSLAEDGSLEKSAINLFDRVLVITLVLLGLGMASI